MSITTQSHRSQAETIRVLHVDDESNLCELTATYLEKLDDRISVTTETEAETALERLAANGFDCIVSDYEMPSFNGLEFLEQVRAQYPQLPFILFTGKGSEEIASQAIAAGVTDYLQKGGTESYELLANRIEQAIHAYKTRHFEHRAKHDPFDLVERVSDAFLALNAEFEFTYLNEQAADEFDRPAEELLGTNIWEQFPDARGTKFYDRYHEALETGEPLIIEEYYEPLDKWYHKQIYPSDEGLSVIFRDISERKKREQEMQDLKDRYAAYIEYSTDLITVLDDVGVIQYQSPSIEHILGYGPNELIGHQAAEFVHPDDRDRVMGMFFELIDKPETVAEEVTFRFKHADGSWVWLESSGVNKSSSAAGGYVINSRDISKRVRREEELKERVKELNALRRTVQLCEAHEGSVSELLAATATDLPQSFKYPEHTEVRLTYGPHNESTSAFGATHDRIEAVEETNAGQVIRLEVGLHQVESEEHHDFIDEERELIRTIVGVLRQYFDRQEHLDELEQTRERYEQILTHLSDYVTIVDESGDISYVSPAMTEMTGFEPDEVIGTSAFKYVHDADQEMAATAFAETISNPETEVTIEYRIRTADGAVRWVEARGSNYLKNPSIGGLLIAVRDITDRKEREVELRQERDRFQAAFDTVPEPAVHVAFEGNEPIVHRVNDAFTKTFGYTQKQVSGQSLDSLIIPEDRLDEAADINRRVRQDTRFEEEIVRQTKAGEKSFLFTAKTMPLGEGKQLEGIGTYVDLTEQKRREEELARQNERLDRFASVVSHDLRNPLSIAVGHLELAAEECDSHHLGDVSHALARMDTLIDDLLTLARQGEPIGEVEIIELGDLVESCWGNVDTRDAMFVPDTNSTIRADRSRLQQLLENLIRNAVEHGGDEVTVRIGDLRDGFYVADDGAGIPDGERDRIFEPGHTRTAGGTGFGLAIVQEVADAHGWQVRVTTSETGGARFEITGVEVVA